MRVIFTGGGTGGHIYPALALARHLKKKIPAAAVLFVGARGGLEEKIVPSAGFDLQVLDVKGFPRRLNSQLFRSASLLVRASRKAGALLNEFSPDYVVGTGGYAAAPVLAASIRKRKKVLLHEQNVIPGVANRFFAPFVDKVCLSFESSRRYFLKKSNLFVTGNPRASEITGVEKATARKLLNMDAALPLLLIVGGSRGAAEINRSAVEMLFGLSGNKELQVFYITGDLYYDEVIKRLQRSRIYDYFGPRLQVRAYQQDMMLALSAADLVITRAGATTIAELTSLGLPAIMIPSPNVVHNHQFVNAQEMSERGGAILIEEKDLDGQSLKDETVKLIFDRQKLEEMQKKSLELGMPEAADNMIKLMQQ